MENRFRKIRCVFIPVAFILIYYLSLRFVFPGYFKPFIPHHSDILDYPYDLSGNGISILKARPVGLILTWFFGVFCSWKGIIVSAAVAIFFSLMLVSEIISRETKNTISTWNLMLYMVLVLIAPTFYLNYSFDIYGTYAQLIGLFAVRLTYCEELSRKPIVRGTLFFSVMLMSFLSKETYLNEKAIDVQLLGRGFAWLDTGTMDSLVDAADFVRMIEQRQGVKISAPEEIAYKNGWIDKEKLLESAARYGKSPYGKHLKAVAEGRVRY